MLNGLRQRALGGLVSGLAVGMAAMAALACLPITPAAAVTIELKGDAGIDRIERQRRSSRGELPLPGTPDLGRLEERIAAGGFAPNAPIFIRIFKDTSTLEVWMQKGGTFALFASYPICNWDGTFGPKLVEGDRQSPEGFYTVGESQLRWTGRYHKAFDLNYPNLLDSAQGRSGSAILIHGACSTVGCFAMTNPVIDEIFMLGTRAMAGGQQQFAVHVFPFKMTEAAMAGRKDSEWSDYWNNLKIGYDMFERSHVPPEIGVCNRRYSFWPGESGYRGAKSVGYRCGMWMAGGGEVEAARVAALPLPKYAVPEIVAAARQQRSRIAQRSNEPWRPSRRLMTYVSTKIAEVQRRAKPVDRPILVSTNNRGEPRRLGLSDLPTARAFAGSCNPNLPACRKFQDLRGQRYGTHKKKNKTVAAAKPRKTDAKRKKS